MIAAPVLVTVVLDAITSSIWNIFFLLEKMVWGLGYLFILPVQKNSTPGPTNPSKPFRSSRS